MVRLKVSRFFRMTLGLLILVPMANVSHAIDELILIEEMIVLHERLIPAANSLAKLLSTIQDKGSAMEAVPKLPDAFGQFGKEFDALAAMLEKVGDFSAVTPPTDPEEVAKLKEIVKRQPELTQGWLLASKAVSQQIERIDSLEGLPKKFWNVYRLETTRQAAGMLSQAGMMNAAAAQDPTAELTVEYFKETLAMMEKYGPDKVAQVHLEGIRPDKLLEIPIECMIRLGRQLEFTHTVDLLKGNGLISLAPIKNFDKLVKSLPAGKSKKSDRGKVTVKIVISEAPLGMEALAAADLNTFNPLVDLPPEDDPDYHEKLADLIPFGSEKAIDKLLQTDPSEIKSKEIRKLIARNFRQLAFDASSPSVESMAIRGLVHYGGKYSIPVLIQLIEREQLGLNEEIFAALANFSDPKAADAVVQVLGDFFNHDEAVSCLRRMGPVAEAALIEVAPSNDAKVSIAAIELLGDVGTEKSFPLLRKAAKSRNLEVRRLANVAIKKIRERQPAKETPTPSP